MGQTQITSRIMALRKTDKSTASHILMCLKAQMQSHLVRCVSRDDCGVACFRTVLYALLDVQQSRLSEMHPSDADSRLSCIDTDNRISRSRAVGVLDNNLVRVCLACTERYDPDIRTSTSVRCPGLHITSM